jgi:hypothetical protein
MTEIPGFGHFDFGNWNLFGGWDLEIGISPLCPLLYAVWVGDA